MIHDIQMEPVEPRTILKALKSLTTVQAPGYSPSYAAHPLNFESLLEHNILVLERELSLNVMKKLKDGLDADASIHISTEGSARQKFVSYCMKLLHFLQLSLRYELEECAKHDPAHSSPSAGPEMSPDTFSYEEKKIVQTAVQFIICLNICPYLQDGVGIPLSMRSEFSSLVNTNGTKDVSEVNKRCQLFLALKVLISCVFIPSLGTLILSKHLADILAGLVQLLHDGNMVNVQEDTELLHDSQSFHSLYDDDVKVQTPASVVDSLQSNANRKNINFTYKCATKGHAQFDESTSISTDSIQNVDLLYCELMLDELIKKVYPPLLVKTFILLQGGPKLKKPCRGPMLLPAPDWLRQFCGQQLSLVIMRTKGVQSVLRGMLDSPGACQGMTVSSDWRKCDAVARIIACCPLHSVSQNEYYKHIGPQVLELLHIQDEQLCSQFLRVACTTIARMYKQSRQLTDMHILEPMLQPLHLCLQETDGGHGVIVSEEDLCQCIQDCHRVYVCGGLEMSSLMISLRPVLGIISQLWQFTIHGLWSHKKFCQEILVSYLSQAEKEQALDFLKMVALQQSSCDMKTLYPRMQQSLRFANSDKGGVMVVLRTQCVKETTENKNIDCTVALLQEFQLCSLAGEFLVLLMQELTQVIYSEVVEKCNIQHPPCDIGGASQDLMVDGQGNTVQFERKMAILHLLAMLCEKLGPECIQNAHQTLQFVKATLERGIQVCQSSDEVMTQLFETETITMAMGLLTALLTGAFQLTVDDRSCMDQLTPLLHELSTSHPEPSIQEMATDIRIAIATHGAVFSEMSQFCNTSKKVDPTTRGSKFGGKKEVTSQKPLIEIVSESVTSSPLESNTTFDKTKISVQNVREDFTSQFNTRSSNEQDLQIFDDINVNNVNLDINSHAVNKGSDNSDCLEETNRVEVDEGPAERMTTVSTDREQCVGPELDQVFRELTDPLVPVRGHGLIRLTRMVRDRSPEVKLRRDVVLKIFLENLDHDDSYMYLSAINGLSAMSDLFPDLLLPTVCQQFALLDQPVGRTRKQTTELRMKLGEILVKAARNLGELLPHYRDGMLRSVLVGSRDQESMVRASSLSALGDICKLLHFSLGAVLHEVLECVSSLLKHDENVQVRRAAGQCLTLLLQGAADTNFKVLEPVLRDLYRALKVAASMELDEGVRQHISIALTELDQAMRKQLFPIHKLEKKIQVLDFN